jgi:hypothetical protein
MVIWHVLGYKEVGGREKLKRSATVQHDRACNAGTTK